VNLIIQIFKPNVVRISQKLTKERERKKEVEIQFHQQEKQISRKDRKKKLTVDDLHHVACFDLQTAIPTATGDVSNIC
jgi:hypothetical protein